MYNDITLVEKKYLEPRGNIYTIYDKRKISVDCTFVQDKVSKSNQGVIRGFHGDEKTWKLVACLHGKIKLVTYNIDTDEKKVYILDGDSLESTSVLVPPRTLNAHQCLSAMCIFYYKWSEYYTAPKDQWSVHYDDPDIFPEWEEGLFQTVSIRDQAAQSLKELKKNVTNR
jgi:dTDP-4-dehydrorhamnose 3,5-epimerase